MTAISSIHITIKRPAFQAFSYRHLSPVLPTPLFGALSAPISINPQQLNQLLQHNGIACIEIDVTKILQHSTQSFEDIIANTERCHAKNITPVIYTSRTELQFDDQQTRLAFGEQVSAFLMDVVRNLPITTGFLISKGGITSNDVLSDGLALRTSRVAGQILAGCSVVRCPDEYPRFPAMWAMKMRWQPYCSDCDQNISQTVGKTIKTGWMNSVNKITCPMQ